MSYAVIYAQNGEFIADFDSHDEAVEALRAFVGEHPSVIDEVGLIEFDEGGHPVGEFVPASAHEQFA
jgi:hypothetical protein